VHHENFAANLAIEEMKPEHLPEIVAIVNETDIPPWTKGIFCRELNIPFSRSLVCRVWSSGQSITAGFICFWIVAGEVQLQNLAVRRDMRRRGIASRLMEEMFREAKARGAGRITLELRQSNCEAGALYRKFGFASEGVRKGYYGGGDGAALILWADLAGNGKTGDGNDR